MKPNQFLLAVLLTTGLTACLGTGLNPTAAVPAAASSASGAPVISFSGSPISVMNEQYATAIVGQTTSSANATGNGATDLNGPIGAVTVSGTTLFVPDTNNQRIQAFDPIPTGIGPTSSLTVNADGWHLYQTLTVTAGNTFFGLLSAGDDDIGLLGWNAPPATNVAADFHVGTNNGGGGPIDTSPQDVSTAGTKLVVANGGGNNILIFNTIPTSVNPTPDLILTQSSSGTLSNPSGVWTNGTVLVVADTGNNKVLVWNNFPATDVAPDFALDTTPGAAMSGPTSVFVTSAGQLFVCDTANNRVLVWNSMPTADHTPPNNDLGQSDFNGVGANEGFTTDIFSLSAPHGVYVSGGKIFVTDTGNNRILIY